MKKKQTAKYRKQHNKEKASRKAKQEQTRSGLEAQHDMLFGENPIKLKEQPETKPVAEPISPARRAFEGL